MPDGNQDKPDLTNGIPESDFADVQCLARPCPFYHADDDALWESSRKMFAGLIRPRSMRTGEGSRGLVEIRRSKKPRKDRDICRTVAITFHKKWRKIPVISPRTAAGTRSPFSSVQR